MASSSEAEAKHELEIDLDREREHDDQRSISFSLDQEGASMKIDVHDAAVKIGRAKEAYRAYTGEQVKPSRAEIWMWYLYETCSHFIVTTVLPIVFPLIIGQIVRPWNKSSDEGDDRSWGETPRGIACTLRQIKLYSKVTHRSISVNSLNFSAMEWTSVSWALGLIVAAPLLALTSKQLDHGRTPQLIAGAATAVGALACLPVGFFKTPYIFPIYIASIVASYIVASASHTRHLGLMVRGYTGPTLRTTSQFLIRRAASGWFSTYATSAGALGSAVFSAFTYHMLRNKKDPFVSLWVVSIFSGLNWFIGMSHIFNIRPGGTRKDPESHNFMSIFKYPHAIASLVVVFMASFSSMCIFTGGMLFLLGRLCLEPVFFLYIWLIYFIFPSLSMPLLQPLQQLIKADAGRMQLLGFFLTILTSGFGFYYKAKNWEKHHVLLFAAVQSTSAGLLHAFGRVLLLDCTPVGSEGAFSVWHSWVKAIGTWAGFAVASGISGNVGGAFGASFWTAAVGVLVLSFGNISDVGGAMAAAGHQPDEGSDDGGRGRGSPVSGLDTGIVMKEHQAHEEEAA